MCGKCVTGCPYSRWAPFGNPRNFFYWLSHWTCEVLVAQPGIKLRPMTVREWSPKHWTFSGIPIWQYWSQLLWHSFFFFSPNTVILCVYFGHVISGHINCIFWNWVYSSINWGCSARWSQRSLLVQRAQRGWEMGVCRDDENKISRDLNIVEPGGSVMQAHWILLLLHMIGIFHDETFYLKGLWFFLNLLPSPIPDCECSILTWDTRSQTAHPFLVL